MGKLDYDEKGDEWIIDGSEDAPILGGSKNKHRSVGCSRLFITLK